MVLRPFGTYVFRVTKNRIWEINELWVVLSVSILVNFICLNIFVEYRAKQDDFNDRERKILKFLRIFRINQVLILTERIKTKVRKVRPKKELEPNNICQPGIDAPPRGGVDLIDPDNKLPELGVKILKQYSKCKLEKGVHLVNDERIRAVVEHYDWYNFRLWLKPFNPLFKALGFNVGTVIVITGSGLCYLIWQDKRGLVSNLAEPTHWLFKTVLGKMVGFQHARPRQAVGFLFGGVGMSGGIVFLLYQWLALQSITTTPFLSFAFGLYLALRNLSIDVPTLPVHYSLSSNESEQIAFEKVLGGNRADDEMVQVVVLNCPEPKISLEEKSECLIPGLTPGLMFDERCTKDTESLCNKNLEDFGLSLEDVITLDDILGTKRHTHQDPDELPKQQASTLDLLLLFSNSLLEKNNTKNVDLADDLEYINQTKVKVCETKVQDPQKNHPQNQGLAAQKIKRKKNSKLPLHKRTKTFADIKKKNQTSTKFEASPLWGSQNPIKIKKRILEEHQKNFD